MKRLLLLAVIASAMLVIPSTASATVDCNLAGGVLTVNVTGTATQSVGLRMANAGVNVGVYDSSSFGVLQACTNGPATVANTNSIVIADTDPGTQTTIVGISMEGGPFLNNVAEGGGNPEIEIHVDGGNEADDDLVLTGAPLGTDDNWRMGELPVGEGYQLDDSETGTVDVDDLVTTNMEALQIGSSGNAGNDTLDARGGAGFTGPLSPASTVKQLVGGTGDDQIFAGDGDNWRVEGDEGADTLIGGPGSDFIQLSFGTDADTADGNGGSDNCSYLNHPAGVNVDLRITAPQDTVGAGIDTISDCETLAGSNGPDVLIGTPGPNMIFGGPGADTLIGLGGDDTLNGVSGADTVSYAQGSTGPVTVNLGTAGAQNTGGAGTDTISNVRNIIGSPFSDNLTGDANPNTIDAYDGLLDTVDCAGGADTAIADELGVDTLTNCETTDNAPKVSMGATPADAAVLNDPTPAYPLTADEAATFQVSVDGGGFISCGASCEPPALADGAHTLRFRAVDTDENLHPGLNPVSRSVTIDTVAPDLQIVDGPSGDTEDTTPTFSFASADATEFQCRIDADAFGPCSGPGDSHTPAVLGEGSHTFEVQATDAAGNTALATRAFTVLPPAVGPQTFTPDKDAPDTTIKKAKVRGDQVKVRFSSSETGSTFRCKLDRGKLRRCGSPKTFKNLDAGKHKITVVATDAVGNVDPTPAKGKFRIP